MRLSPAKRHKAYDRGRRGKSHDYLDKICSLLTKFVQSGLVPIVHHQRCCSGSATRPILADRLRFAVLRS